MNSIDPGEYLAGLGSQQSSSAPTMSDADILKLAAGPVRSATGGAVDMDASGNTSAAMRALPTGSNKFTTWLKNAPIAAGGEFDRLYHGITGQPMDPLSQAVLSGAKNNAPGAAPLTDMLATLPATMGATAALPALGLGAVAANPLALGAVQGGLQGALTANPGQRLQQGALGAVTGAALPMVGGALGKLATGLSRTPAAQSLLDQGVTLPPGLLNPSGAGNTAEQALTHIPLIGSKVAGARNAVPAQITDLMTQDAVAPGQRLPKGLNINDAVSGLKNGYDAAYTSAVGGYPAAAKIMRTTGSDIPLTNAFNSVISTARPGLTPGARTQLGNTLQAQLQEVINAARQSGQGLQATDLQQFRSTLRTLAREAPEGTTQSAVRGFWQDAQDKVTQALESQLPPKSAALLRATDAQYGKFATVSDLANSVKDRTPTMNDWSSAIARNTPDPVYAAGGGWNRGLIQSAAQVVKPTVAHTGALGAGAIAPAMAGLEAALHPSWVLSHPLASVGTGAGIGGLWSAYTQPGMRALAGQTAPQKAVMGLLNSLHPTVKAGLKQLLQSSGTQGLLSNTAPSQGLLSQPAPQ